MPRVGLRALLIILALEPGHVVSKASLTDWIWGEDPSADAANVLQRLASRLRKALPDGVVVGHADGYLLIDPDAGDAARFERLHSRSSNRTARSGFGCCAMPSRCRAVRIMLGQDGADTAAELERALMELRELGEWFGTYLALSTLAAAERALGRVCRCLPVQRPGDSGPHRARCD